MRKIVVDIYGADAGIEPIAKGIAKALHAGMDFLPVMVGEEAAIRSLLDESGIAKDRYEVIDTKDFISHNEPPHCIFGGRDESSMALAYGKLKSDPDCFAMLSPGSTGALLVGSICRLGLLPGLKFPALASALPCGGENLVCLVDCGANMDCTSDDLVRFAKMGNVLSQSVCGIERPRVGLMSVGREAQKGNALTKEAFAKIQALDLNFVGNLEGGDLVTDYADVIVCDGYAGNLLLKCAEASGKRAMAIVEKLGADADPDLIARIKQELFLTFDFNARGGATFLGPKKTVVKMHGCANEDTVVASLEQIMRLEKAGFASAIAAVMNG